MKNRILGFILAVGVLAVSVVKVSYAQQIQSDTQSTLSLLSVSSNGSGTLGSTYSTEVIPKPMDLSITSVVTSKWNSAPDAFGLWRIKEGGGLGPSAVAYEEGRIYLLDTVKNRVLGFDKSGTALLSVALPFATPTDLVTDSATKSFIVVAQYTGDLCRVSASGAVTRLPSVNMKHLVFPAKFTYETNSQTLFAQNATTPKKLSPILRAEEVIKASAQITTSVPTVTVDIARENVILNLNGGTQTIVLYMGKNVFCVEDVVTDAQGAIWALYTLEGDYQMRRLFRVDVAKEIAGVATIDAWFAFDATRHMAAMENGVVLFAGNLDEGRIVTVEYTGGIK